MHSASSNHICTRLRCTRPKHASGKSGAGRRLSRWQHRRTAKRSFRSHQWRIQHCGWFLSLLSNSTNSFNTAIGAGTLLANSADQNTAIGAGALLSNTTGTENTANGTFALFSNTIGFENTANGVQALFSNITAPGNTATGFQALLNTTTGEGINTATGGIVLYSNTTGHRNAAAGFQSMFSNTTGARNTATGMSALFFNTTGNFNTAFGWTALDNNQTGSLNTALGFGAGYFLTGDNNIDIGTGGDSADSNTIRIGTVVEYTDPDPPNEVHPVHTATYIAGISGQIASGGIAVYINSDGKLGTLTSSARFKTEIKAMDKSSEAILALKPVTFRYKQEIDSKGIPQFGLVAEEVEKVDPDLVARDADGKPYTVRYEAVNAMLLNEFLKEHKAFVAEQRKVEKLEATIAGLVVTMKEQASQIQKVSPQLQLSKFATGRIRGGGPEPQTVLNNP
jgi:Chaperone of endosialidase